MLFWIWLTFVIHVLYIMVCCWIKFILYDYMHILCKGIFCNKEELVNRQVCFLYSDLFYCIKNIK
jgi:hypothetical protein